MKTKLIPVLLLCSLVAACSPEEDPALADQNAVFAMLEEFGRVNAAGDYEKAWDFLSQAKQESFRLLLSQPITGAIDTVANLRPIVEPESKADVSEKERVKGILAKFPPWETLKNMTPKQYYAWRMEHDYPPERKKQATTFYHRDNIQRMELEGNSGYIDYVPTDAKRQYLVKEGGKWKFGLEPKLEREFAATKTKQEKR